MAEMRCCDTVGDMEYQFETGGFRLVCPAE